MSGTPSLNCEIETYLETMQIKANFVQIQMFILLIVRFEFSKIFIFKLMICPSEQSNQGVPKRCYCILPALLGPKPLYNIIQCMHSYEKGCHNQYYYESNISNCVLQQINRFDLVQCETTPCARRAPGSGIPHSRETRCLQFGNICTSLS